ncbi:hypothetical protein C0Q70_17458 [Pomacea canaliculata]|uniref:Ig-like domain-containing protein n=1 Tax=Pomacea canaliculata TaxID=400727 RepID=A0A2T7NKH4_POMCA|nr:hypothetical protein C0Q70_17458 [Pomacea canaliculata]
MIVADANDVANRCGARGTTLATPPTSGALTRGHHRNGTCFWDQTGRLSFFIVPSVLFEMKRVHGSILLAIICFDGLLSHEECRRRNRFQVSVLSRDRTITLDDWEHLGDVLPVPLTDLDTTVKLEVTSRLVRPHSAAVYSVGALVGSTILLNCTLGDDDPSDEVAYVYWVQDTKRRALTSNLQRQTGDFRFTALHTQPRRWSLRINEITSRDSDVYICYVGNNPVTKLALFAAGNSRPPTPVNACICFLFVVGVDEWFIFSLYGVGVVICNLMSR